MSLKNLSFYSEFEQDDLDQFQDEGITTNPADYYFSVVSTPDSNLGGVEIVITPKKLFDAEQRWSDSGWVAPILMESGALNGYEDLCEAMYESEDGLSVDQIRLDLAKQGFIENTKLHATCP